MAMALGEPRVGALLALARFRRGATVAEVLDRAKKWGTTLHSLEALKKGGLASFDEKIEKWSLTTDGVAEALEANERHAGTYR